MEFLAKAEPAGPLRAAWSWLKQTDLIPIKALPLAFPPSAHLLLSGNDFSGYFGRSFWSAPSG
jgi:hypothetical protein